MENKFLSITCVVATFLLVTCAVVIREDLGEDDNPVPSACLECICEAQTGCNYTFTCFGTVCGRFRITEPYWKDAGSFVIEGDHPDSRKAFANCATDAYCAARTVQSYMQKFKQDCNNDGVIDCYDYAAIHKLGGYGCNKELTYNYASTLIDCLRSITGYDDPGF